MRRRRLTALLALGASLAAAQGARADELPERGWKSLEVGVLPVRSYVRRADQLFTPGSEVRRLQQAAGGWQRRIEERLDGLPTLTVRTVQQSLDRLREAEGYERTVSLAADRYDLGVERYRALEVDAALDQLDRAASLYRDGYADVTAAQRLADVQLHRGLALMEQGQSNRAHIAFRRMWLLQPSRRFDEGYYPASVERALAGSFRDLHELPDKLLTRFPLPRLKALSRRAEVDAWILAAIVGPVEAPVLHLVAYDRSSDAVVLDERIGLADGRKTARRRLERALSSWHTCTVRRRRQPFVERERPRPWHMDIGFRHTMMLKHDRTRELFHSPGARLDLSWGVAPNLHLYAVGTQMISVPDPNEDLLDSFVTSRLAVGTGLTAGSDDLRAYLRTGLELALAFEDIRMTNNVECKHFGADHPRCGGDIFTLSAPGVWFGLNLGAGVRWHFREGWFLHASGSFSSYVASPDLVDELNFPVSFGLGVGSRL